MMMRAWYSLFVIAALILAPMLPVLVSADAFAQSPPSSAGSSGALETVDANGNRLSCSSFNDADGALMGKVMPCLAHTVQEATIRMAAEMSDFLQPAFWAFVTLVIAFQGVQGVQAERSIGPQTFLFLLKLTFIIAFVDSLAGFIPAVFDVMRESEDIMAGALIPSAAGGGFQCDFTQYLPSDRPGHILWAEFDCALGHIFGFAVGTGDRPSMILAASVLGLLGGFFFGGTFGFAVFFAAIGFLWSLLAFVIRSGFAFANAYLLVAIYIIISPLFIPLALLRPTTQYFQNWLRGFMGAFLMPVIVTAYGIFALLIFDNLLFQDGSNGEQPSVLYQLLDYSCIQDAQRHAKTVDAGTIINDQGALAQSRNLEATQGAGAFATQNRIPGLPGFFGANQLQVQLPNFEAGRVNCIDGLSDDEVAFEKEFYTQLLIDFAKLFILGLIILQGWKLVSELLLVLTSSGVSGQTISAVSTVERNFQSAVRSGRQAAEAQFYQPGEDGQRPGPGGATGTEFIRQLPSALQAGASNFLGGIGR